MSDLRRIRICLAAFMLGLALSGLTAFPLVTESGWLVEFVAHFATGTPLTRFVWQVHQGLVETSIVYPFLAYGTDWLAFAHLVLTVLFIGPYRDPVRNKWVLQFGLIACAGVLPLAFIAGPIRGIPLYWRLVDSSFGIVGCIPLLIALSAVKRMEARTHAA